MQYYTRAEFDGKVIKLSNKTWLQTLLLENCETIYLLPGSISITSTNNQKRR